MKKAFTLIELVIVIAILGILSVAVLAAINPAEAQRKSRDIKRMNDLRSLQTAIEQWLADGGTPPGATTTWTSASGNTNCLGGWLGLTGGVCRYTPISPIDPQNNATRTMVNGGTPPNCTTGSLSSIYRVTMDNGGQYEVNVRQESTSNCNKIVQDGGNSSLWAEIGSSLTLVGN